MSNFRCRPDPRKTAIPPPIFSEALFVTLTRNGMGRELVVLPAPGPSPIMPPEKPRHESRCPRTSGRTQTPPPATGWRGLLRADNRAVRRGSRSAAGSYPILLIALIRHGSAFLSDTLAIWADLGPRSEKRIFRTSMKKRRLRFLGKRRLSGGGGNRTRVPRHFHRSFYVRSRMFGFRPPGP